MAAGLLPYWFVGFVVVGVTLGVVAVWARRSLWIRAGAVVLVAAMLALQYVALTDLLSRPKPTDMELTATSVGEATVLAASIDEGKAIYLWLRLPDQHQPRYYALPWDHGQAVELQRAIREAGRHGTRVIMRSPFEKSLDDRRPPKFYDLPRISLPRKPKPEVLEYRHPSLTL